MLSKAAYDYFFSCYKSEYPSKMIEFCIQGASPEAFASQINVTPEIFAFWCRAYPEFEIALHIAFWKSYAWWDQQLRFNSDKLGIQAGVFKLVMENRFKWVQDSEENRRKLHNMSLEELETLARRLLDSKEVKAVEFDPEADED